MFELRLYKESMWDLSKKMNEEDKLRDTTTSSCPKNEDEPLNHMASTIRNITRFPAQNHPCGPLSDTSTISQRKGTKG